MKLKKGKLNLKYLHELMKVTWRS